MPTPADSVFYFVEPYGTYYLSIWTNAGPGQAQWYGSYGIDTQVRTGHPSGTDARPDTLVLSAGTPLHTGLVVEGFAPAPHWISGTITFNGTRPAEGLLVMVTTFPVSPLQPPTGQPFGYFRITDPNETLYAFTGMPEGTYYVSLWNNSQQSPACYGAYGYTAGSDTDPDPVTLGATAATWGAINKNIIGNP